MVPDRKKETRPAATSAAGAKRDEADGKPAIAGIVISHPERVLFEDPKITKLDLARYYQAVAGRLLAYGAGHPVSLVRCPGGDIAHCFFQKHAGDGFPDKIKQLPIREASGNTENYMVLTDDGSLVAAVQMGTMEFHIWGAAADTLEQPDRMVFDLDPDESVGFETVRQAAVELRQVLDSAGLKSVPMVTGGKGVHVVAPLVPKADWDDVKTFAKGLSLRLADEQPDRYVATMSKEKRKGRIFIDWLRNERGSTAVVPYSVRARKGAPVATPVTWEELSGLKAANAFSIADVLERIGKADPWAAAGKWRQSLTDQMVSAAVGA